MSTWIIVLLLSVAIGTSLGLLGSGGAIFLVPLLVYVMHIEAAQAIPMSLVVVALTSGIGAILHARRGNFHSRAAIILGSTGILGAVIGSQLTHLAPQPVIMTLFAVVMLSSGGSMLGGKKLEPRSICRVWPCLAIGLFAGLLTGFLGGGGALVMIPGMVLLAGVPMPQAVGSSLAILCFNAVAALVGHLQVTTIAWDTTAIVAVATLVGMAAGVTLSTRVGEAGARKTFGWVILAVALAVAVQAVSSLVTMT